MITDEYFSLVEKLVHRTSQGEVNWKSTSDNHQFLVYFNKFTLSVSQSFDQHNQEAYIRIVLLNDEGSEIDSFWVHESDNHWELASQLFTGARRKALQIDEAIHTIMDELDNKDTVGKKELPIKEEFDDGIPF
ncbi:MAG: hypothetical protein N0C86_14990 [Candidatus Thiodiazotropha taylori]|nr:hypothetical protein [Candidatus Thiodiazotropha taylori]MCW4327299.1 hypothetical protein [Candidatus Thiodiazotropha taylori]